MLTIVTLSCSGQTDKPVISATKMNVLYKGIDNPISIAVPNYSCTDLHVTVTNGTLTGDNCEYSINPDKIGQAYITVMTIDDRDTTILGKSEFRVKRIAAPTATFCVQPWAKEIKKEQALNCLGLVLVLENLHIEVPYKVIQYDLVIIHNGCRTAPLKSVEAKLTYAMKDALKEIQTSDIIAFENIKAIDPNATINYLDPITLEEIPTLLKSKPFNLDDLRLKIK